MNTYQKLKSIWKKFGVKGQVKNFSSKSLWVLETGSKRPIARVLKPGFKSPKEVDADAFKRLDGRSIEGHRNWWKFYDFSTAEVFDKGTRIRVSLVSKTAVHENHFGEVVYKRKNWGKPLQIISDVQRDKKRRIVSYYLTGTGWIGFDRALHLTCHHKIDNARPVFPIGKMPYIRTRRDQVVLNNLSYKGRT